MVYEVEERRNFFNDISKRRAKAMEEMDSKIIQLQINLPDDDE